MSVVKNLEEAKIYERYIKVYFRLKIFREGHSASHALVDFISSIYDSFNQN